MDPTLGSTSIDALQHQYLVITHNLANASTAGFKRSQTVFEQVLASRLAAAGASEEVQTHTAVDFTQGPLVQTGRSLDLALTGKGLFVVEDPAAPGGRLYTRNGVFRTNAARQLVDAAGRLVQGDAGPIVLPDSVGIERVSVSREGQVSAGGQAIGKLQVVSFEDESVLQPVGASTFRAAADVQPAPATGFGVHQGFQEGSNVSTVEELVRLIMVTRLYEANIKTAKVQDERMANILRVAMS